MVRFVSPLRVFAAGLGLALLSVGCQAVFDDFKIDDAAFQGAGASGGSTSDNTNGDAGVAGVAGVVAGGVVVQGPIQLAPTSGLYTTEWGGQAKFTIVLGHKPSADVTVALSSSNKLEGTVSPESVVFTKDDWKAPQVVTVTGVDDTVPDPNTRYKIETAP